MPDKGALDEMKGVARGLYEKLIGVKPEPADPGIRAIATGAGAVARTEAMIARLAGGAAGLRSGDPSPATPDGAASAYERSAPPQVGRVASASGRGSLAAAVGLASAGVRATAFLGGPDLVKAGDLLASAADRRLPLVVHLADRETGAVGGSRGALEIAAGSGAVVLIARSAQEAVDLTVAGRRVAEDVLLPVVVAMDGAETAASVQDFLLPTDSLLRAYLGSPADMVHPVTRSQELLFGRHRRRLPTWHDPSRPLTTGALHGPESAPLAAAGRRAYLDAELPALLETALADLARRTGRPLAPVTTHHTDGAKIVLVVAGTAVGTAEAAADTLRKEGLKAGVIGLRALAPWPGGRLSELLRSPSAVAVLERGVGPLAAGADLDATSAFLVTRLRALASRTGRGTETSRQGGPRFVSALYGLGGAPLRAADLVELGRTLGRDLVQDRSRKGSGDALHSPVFLGVSFTGEAAFPKQEVLLDALRQSYPDATRFGLRGAGSVDLRPEGSTLVAVHRLAGASGAAGLVGDAARLLHETVLAKTGERVATHAGLSWERWAAPVSDRLLFGPAGSDGTLADPGADAPVDVALWASPEAKPSHTLTDRLADGAAVVVPRRTGDASADLTDWWTDLPEAVRAAIEQKGAHLYVVELGSDDVASGTDAAEALFLGALIGTLRTEGRIEVKDRKLLDAFRALGSAHGGDEATRRFQAGLERVRRLGAADLSVRRRPPAEPDPVPAAVRRLATAGAATTSGKGPLRGAPETIDSLPRFWDQVGVLYRRGEEARLTPDPYLAVGAVPALAGSLRQVEHGRTVLPAFEPALCTGCGDCWSACPDGAIAPVVLGAGQLLDQAMARARRAGKSVDALRMAASKIVAGVNQELASRVETASGGDAAELFATAFEKTLAKMPLPEERKASLTEAFAAVRDELDGLPVARTAPFFEGPEAEASLGKGSGELFLLAVDPDACKGCGVCVATCEPEALRAQPDGIERTRAARGLWRRLEELPEPGPETVERARSHEDSGMLAGAMLPRSSREIVAAADGAEAGSGASLAVRQTLAAAAYHLDVAPEAARPARLAAIDALREELAGAIHEDLARALPDRDLDALASGLGTLNRPDADLADLTSRVENALEGDRVDVARLRRLVDAARRLADLRVRLGGSEAGGSAQGNARPAPLGLVLAGRAAAWGGAFPYTPFAVPVTVDATGDATGVARGLLEGGLVGAVEMARAARRARIELGARTPSEAAKAAEEVKALTRLAWRDLDAAERSLCPPVMVVASEDELLADDPGGLADLLAGELPVKVVLLADAAGADRPAPTSRWLQWVGHPNAVVVQTSVGVGDHLATGMAAALAYDGPALVRVHAPEPSREGFPADATLERAREAVATRAFPLFVSLPGTGQDEGSDGLPRVDLAGNPEPEATEDCPPERLRAWRMLQHRAGADEAFAAAAAATEERERAEQEAREHEQEIATLRAEYEQRLAEAQATTQAEMARRVRNKLLALAARRAASSPGNGSEYRETTPETSETPREERQ